MFQRFNNGRCDTESTHCDCETNMRTRKIWVGIEPGWQCVENLLKCGQRLSVVLESDVKKNMGSF